MGTTTEPQSLSLSQPLSLPQSPALVMVLNAQALRVLAPILPPHLTALVLDWMMLMPTAMQTVANGPTGEEEEDDEEEEEGAHGHTHTDAQGHAPTTQLDEEATAQIMYIMCMAALAMNTDVPDCILDVCPGIRHNIQSAWNSLFVHG